MVDVIKEVTKVYKTVNKVPSQIANLSTGQLENLADFAKDPRGFVLGIIVLWIVEQIFAATRAILAQVFMIFDLLATIPAVVLEPFGLAGSAMGKTLLTMLEVLTQLAFSTVSAAGPFAPLVAAILLVVVYKVVEIAGPPLASAATDLLGAVPVVGSVLDALATFVVDVLGRLGGDS